MSVRNTNRTIKKAFWLSPKNATYIEDQAAKAKMTQGLWLDELINKLYTS